MSDDTSTDPLENLDIARGDVTQDDLDSLELAIEGVDFASRRATPDVLQRLQSLSERLADVTAQVAAGRRTIKERPPISEQNRRRYEALVDDGVAAGERGDLATARQKLEEAALLDPEGKAALFNLGVVYGLLAHHNIARAEFYDDHTRDAVFIRKAEICYDHVLELDPDHLATLNNLATLYSMRDDRDQAITTLRRILAIDPQNDEDQRLVENARSQLKELEP